MKAADWFSVRETGGAAPNAATRGKGFAPSSPCSPFGLRVALGGPFPLYPPFLAGKARLQMKFATYLLVRGPCREAIMEPHHETRLANYIDNLSPAEKGRLLIALSDPDLENKAPHDPRWDSVKKISAAIGLGISVPTAAGGTILVLKKVRNFILRRL